jgi:hypothetical protein
LCLSACLFCFLWSSKEIASLGWIEEEDASMNVSTESHWYLRVVFFLIQRGRKQNLVCWPLDFLLANEIHNRCVFHLESLHIQFCWSWTLLCTIKNLNSCGDITVQGLWRTKTHWITGSFNIPPSSYLAAVLSTQW